MFNLRKVYAKSGSCGGGGGGSAPRTSSKSGGSAPRTSSKSRANSGGSAPRTSSKTSSKNVSAPRSVRQSMKAPTKG